MGPPDEVKGRAVGTHDQRQGLTVIQVFRVQLDLCGLAVVSDVKGFAPAQPESLDDVLRVKVDGVMAAVFILRVVLFVQRWADSVSTQRLESLVENCLDDDGGVELFFEPIQSHLELRRLILKSHEQRAFVHFFFRCVRGRGLPKKKRAHLQEGMEDAASAMRQYCRAQAQINAIARQSNDLRKQLTEQARTYRTLIQDEMDSQQLTCVEVYPVDKKEPTYLRLRPQTKSASLEPDMVIELVKDSTSENLLALAEKSGHDLPRMLVALLNEQYKARHVAKTDKRSLSVCAAKERGFTHTSQNAVPPSIVHLGKEYLKVKGELAALNERDNTQKRAALDEQKTVESSVKESLKKADPQNMTTRVSMVQDGAEWVYYLRCREKKTAPTIGIRRVGSLFEQAVVVALEKQGLSREFNPSLRLGRNFWAAVSEQLSLKMDAALSESKVTSKLTLDRGAPRKGRVG